MCRSRIIILAKFQIPVGIPQNSEFCRKLLPIRPEPRSGVLIFFIFTRPEHMNLNSRCDTRICRSKSELLRNHTNGIQDIKFPRMSEFARLIFSSTTQLNNNGILIGIVSVPPNPQSTRGLRSRHHHSPLAICMEKAATVSFPLAFFFSPLFPIILTAALSIRLLFCRWHGSPSLS